MVQTAGRVTVETDVEFGTGGGRAMHCDVYTPPQVASGELEAAPAVLLVHGGGWQEGDKKQLAGYGVLLGREGVVCVASEYRLSGEAQWPAQIHDVNAAIRWVRANAASLHVDPDQIAIAGNSAGGHLSLLAAGSTGVAEFEGTGGHPEVSSGVAAVMAYYAPVDFVELGFASEARRRLMGDAEEAVWRAASPLTYAGGGPQGGHPPTLLIHGNGDATVAPTDSTRLYEALLAAGVPVELHMYAQAPHGFDAQREFGRQTAAVMELFLRRYVTGEVRTITAEDASAAT